MSAYLCDQDTINAIATFAADHKLVADAKLFADLLTLQNVASIKALYPGRKWLKREVIDVAKAYRYERVEYSAAAIAEKAREYDYQACETDDYDNTLCKRLVDRTEKHAQAVHELERKGGCGAARVDFFAHLEDDKLVCDEPKGDDMSGRLLTAGDAEAFILAGKATVTLVSLKTGTRFTYRISASPDKSCHFVALLNGADNEGDYKYLGRIARSMFWAGRKIPKAGDIGRDAPSMRAFAWAWQQIVRGALPETLEVWHSGRCGRCARKLTVPSSIASGFGPECITRMG